MTLQTNLQHITSASSVLSESVRTQVSTVFPISLSIVNIGWRQNQTIGHRWSEGATHFTRLRSNTFEAW